MQQKPRDKVPRKLTLGYDVDRQEILDDPNHPGFEKLLEDVYDPEFGKKRHRSFRQIKVILTLVTFAIYAVFVWALKEFTPELIFWIFSGIMVAVAVIVVWIIWRPEPLRTIEEKEEK